MKYESGYVVTCLRNYDFMKQEYNIKRLDLLKEKQELHIEISTPSIGYSERVQSSKLSDPTYEALEQLEKKQEKLNKRIQAIEDQLESLERVILVFEKFLSVMPKHYHVVDRMVFSDRMKVSAVKLETNKGSDTLKNMRENMYKAIGEVANSEYSNDEILDMEPGTVWLMLDDDLESAIKRNEKW